MEMNFRDFVKKDKPMATTPQRSADEIIRNARRVVKKPVPPRPKPTNESTDIMTESQNMISVLQEKVEQVFYRFGMVGLERLDECMIDTISDLMEGRSSKASDAPVAARRVQPKKPKVVKQEAPAAQPAPKAVPSVAHNGNDVLAIAAAGLKSMGPLEGRYVAGNLATQNSAAPVAAAQPVAAPAAPSSSFIKRVEEQEAPLTSEEQEIMAQNSMVRKVNNFSMDDLAALGAALKG